MKSIFDPLSVSGILLFTIIGLLLAVLITFFVPSAKKKTGLNLLYILVAGLVIGIVGVRAHALNNLFYLYMVILLWNLLWGGIHVYLSGKLLLWPAKEHFGWRVLFALAIVLIGYAGLLMFMSIVKYHPPAYFTWYNLSAVLTFFIPLFVIYSYETFFQIPAKLYLPKPWIYNQCNEPQYPPNVSHFLIIKYKLRPHLNGTEVIESLPLRAQENTKLGAYFDSTLEYYKVTQGRYNIDVKDHSNKCYGWYFFLIDGRGKEKLLDPNLTLHECGLSDSVYFGNPSTEEIENITYQAEKEGKANVIICKREQEYKSQLMKS